VNDRHSNPWRALTAGMNAPKPETDEERRAKDLARLVGIDPRAYEAALQRKLEEWTEEEVSIDGTVSRFRADRPAPDNWQARVVEALISALPRGAVVAPGMPRELFEQLPDWQLGQEYLTDGVEFAKLADLQVQQHLGVMYVQAAPCAEYGVSTPAPLLSAVVWRMPDGERRLVGLVRTGVMTRRQSVQPELRRRPPIRKEPAKLRTAAEHVRWVPGLRPGEDAMGELCWFEVPEQQTVEVSSLDHLGRLGALEWVWGHELWKAVDLQDVNGEIVRRPAEKRYFLSVTDPGTAELRERYLVPAKELVGQLLLGEL
jgi:hypothetical protein